MRIRLLVLFLLSSASLMAQDDLLKELQSQLPKEPDKKVIATFKGTRIINLQTNETVKKGDLDVRINHQFGNIGKASGGGSHNLWGIDHSYDIRIGLNYGITDRLNIGFARAKRNENLEGNLKFKLLEQTVKNHVPLSVTAYANMTYSCIDKELVNKNTDRITYFAQLILAHKFSSRFSLMASPSFLHRNLVQPGEKNDLYIMGGGFRYKFTGSTSVIMDFAHTFHLRDPVINYYDPIGAGLEIETGGHVFTIMFTNASGIMENDFTIHTTDSWKKGGMKFCFIISRMFHTGKVKTN